MELWTSMALQRVFRIDKWGNNHNKIITFN